MRFYQWLRENEDLMRKTLPTGIGLLENYFSYDEDDSYQTTVILWWDLGRFCEFKSANLEDQSLYIEDNIKKLWEASLDHQDSTNAHNGEQTI